MSQISKYSSGLFLILSMFVFSACTEKQEEAEEHVESSSMPITGKEISAQNVFNSIPARDAIIKLIGESKIEYNPDLLNNPETAAKYSLENSRALNLGVYGADLSVAGAFDQTQESMIFLKCVNILAKNLGVATAFDQRMMERMEAYKENRDSTLEIIAQSFKKADEFLKENNRPGTSSLILSGSWIEGIFISCEIARSVNSENIIKTILTQEESLKHLVNMLEASNLGADSKYILDDLNTLKTTFAQASQKKERNLDTI
ncbi:MAG: hypothetical protein ACXVP0_12755, partial [Bacteroidia bacterium]